MSRKIRCFIHFDEIGDSSDRLYVYATHNIFEERLARQVDSAILTSGLATNSEEINALDIFGKAYALTKYCRTTLFDYVYRKADLE